MSECYRYFDLQFCDNSTIFLGIGNAEHTKFIRLLFSKVNMDNFEMVDNDKNTLQTEITHVFFFSNKTSNE